MLAFREPVVELLRRWVLILVGLDRFDPLADRLAAMLLRSRLAARQAVWLVRLASICEGLSMALYGLLWAVCRRVVREPLRFLLAGLLSMASFQAQGCLLEALAAVEAVLGA